jgi:NAD(P)-dependent dehydrogenase (short-subunit alcohol dehydrogenase family)
MGLTLEPAGAAGGPAPRPTAMRFDDRVAIVTGGSGLGQRIGRALAERGATVFVSDSRRSAPRAGQEIAATGGRLLAVPYDVADPAQAVALAQTAVRGFGRIDVVVNCADAVTEARKESDAGARLAVAWQVTVSGAFNVLQAAWPAMTARGFGRVVNVGARLDPPDPPDPPPALELAAAVAQCGLAGMTRALAAAGAEHGIAVNGLLPVFAEMRPQPASSRLDVVTVVPAAVWLAHEDCPARGRFILAGPRRLAEAYSSAAAGYQCPVPAEFSAEHVRAHWPTVSSAAGSVAPTSSAEYNAFRVAIYEAVVTKPAATPAAQ